MLPAERREQVRRLCDEAGVEGAYLTAFDGEQAHITYYLRDHRGNAFPIPGTDVLASGTVTVRLPDWWVSW